jgi:tripartite-type tricarboxylate transporter receptor subunit TctC
MKPSASLWGCVRRAGSAAALALASVAPAPAQTLVTQPVRFIVPFAAGGGTDIVARVYAANLSKRFGQNVVVDNRPGASGTVGVEMTARAAGDGRTICIISASNAVNSAVNTKLPYDLTRDVQGVSQVTSAFFVLVVRTGFAARTVKELIAYAEANRGKLNYGSSGTGGITHLAGAMFAHLAHITMEHIPYRGEAAAITDLLGGQTQLQFASPLNAAPHLAAGKLRALAVTSPKRNSAMADIPTVAEAALPGYEATQWYGVITSAQTPAATVQVLANAFAAAARDPELTQRLAADGVNAVSSAPREFTAHVAAEVSKWRKLVKEAGLQLQ